MDRFSQNGIVVAVHDVIILANSDFSILEVLELHGVIFSRFQLILLIIVTTDSAASTGQPVMRTKQRDLLTDCTVYGRQ